MTQIAFDPGPCAEPFATLCREYPGPAVYPPADFRLEWGPVFHRGRLDGTARVLVIGQDPAEHEVIGRRILLGTAGHRTQGFLARLGIEHSYVMINTYLFSVYGQTGNRHKNDAPIVAYRARWLDAIFSSGSIEAVVALGTLADHAWQTWRAGATGLPATLAYEHITHPTQPNSASGGDAAKRGRLETTLLANWSAAVGRMNPAITHKDRNVGPQGYGTRFTPGDLNAIPPEDLPAGSPAWMSTDPGWANRTGETALKKRRQILVTATLSK
jgi:hypothetical protein